MCQGAPALAARCELKSRYICTIVSGVTFISVDLSHLPFQCPVFSPVCSDVNFAENFRKSENQKIRPKISKNSQSLLKYLFNS